MASEKQSWWNPAEEDYIPESAPREMTFSPEELAHRKAMLLFEVKMENQLLFRDLSFF